MKFAYTRWMIKCSLGWLIIGSLIGTMMFLQRKYNFNVYLLPVHSHIILVGFLIQFIFGVAFWLFPRLPGGVFTSPTKGWMTFILLNAGTIIRGVSEPIFLKSDIAFWISFLGGTTQFLGIVIGTTEISKRTRAPNY